MVVRQGQHEPFIRNVFTLNTCAPIVGCQVLSFPDERELLKVSLNIYAYPTWAVKLLSITYIFYHPFQFQHRLRYTSCRLMQKVEDYDVRKVKLLSIILVLLDCEAT